MRKAFLGFIAALAVVSQGVRAEEIKFGAMPLVLGFMNYLVPLQLGVRDVAFPTFNSVGFWLTASAAALAAGAAYCEIFVML